MIFGFDCQDEPAAVAALLVYAVYRSRDRRRFKVSPDMWAQIERFTKDAAKRATSIPRFVEALKPRLACDSLRPSAMRIGMRGEVPLAAVYDDTGRMSYAMQLEPGAEHREFLTSIMERGDARAVISRAYHETAWVVALVRDRLERERPIEDQLGVSLDTADEPDLLAAPAN